jgi:hypothetical protein
VFLVAIVGLSLAATRGRAAAACPSACTQQLRDCKRTCASGGQARRDCRAACAERSTCTAPGARIRTLAYVVTACREDPQGLYSLAQKLVIRRGNCDPVTVMEVATPTPVPDLFLFGTCRASGIARYGNASSVVGVFQRIAVLPDGSGVVFEVTKQLSLDPAITPEPPAEGIFFVRADGRSPPRRMGDASRFPTFVAVADPNSPIGLSFGPPDLFHVSPDGRHMALTDFGPDTDGHEAPQIFLLDLRSPYKRTQLTHQSRVVSGLDVGICCGLFLNTRTFVFYAPFPDGRAFQVATDGKSPEKEIPPPAVVSGARIVPQFDVTGASANIVNVYFPDRPAVDPLPGSAGVEELFLIDGKNLVQLTNFGRSDTGNQGGFIARGRVFFTASANPTGENPAEICQLFSINKLGGDLRQLTHLPSDGRPFIGCNFAFDTACSISGVFLDPITGTVLIKSSCDPVGGNPFGDQLFAMRLDGTGLRQLTNARGMTTDPDGTVHVEMPGPIAYSLGRRAATLP